MTEMPIEHAAHVAAPRHHHAQPAQGSPIAALQAAAVQLGANPLIAAIAARPGMGQNLNGADVDTVMRVIASIEAARIEVPARYEQASGARAAMQDGQQ